MPESNHDAPAVEALGPSRRVMLCTLVAAPTLPALAACGGGVSYPDPIVETGGGDDAAAETAPGSCPAATNVGAATSFAVGAYKRAGSSQDPFIVGRDAGGLYAFSALCTHQYCTVSLRSAGASSCGCHGATFDANGRVTRGPASSPLPNYQTTICEGNVFVDTSQEVPIGTRVQG